MTLVHPARTGTAVSVWFIGDEPVRLASGDARYRVVDDPKCADINGERYWRVRAESEDGTTGIFDLRQDGDGWVLAGVDDDPAGTGSR